MYFFLLLLVTQSSAQSLDGWNTCAMNGRTDGWTDGKFITWISLLAAPGNLYAIYSPFLYRGGFAWFGKDEEQGFNFKKLLMPCDAEVEQEIAWCTLWDSHPPFSEAAALGHQLCCPFQALTGLEANSSASFEPWRHHVHLFRCCRGASWWSQLS